MTGMRWPRDGRPTTDTQSGPPTALLSPLLSCAPVYDVVMEDEHDVNAVAHVMVRTFKGRAISTLEDRVSVFNLSGDVRSAKFFWLVAKAVREIEAEP